MEKANFDTTYCISKNCKNKCWRHVDNYDFEDGENYWFLKGCMKGFVKRGDAFE